MEHKPITPKDIGAKEPEIPGMLTRVRRVLDECHSAADMLIERIDPVLHNPGPESTEAEEGFPNPETQVGAELSEFYSMAHALMKKLNRARGRVEL